MMKRCKKITLRAKDLQVNDFNYYCAVYCIKSGSATPLGLFNSMYTAYRFIDGMLNVQAIDENGKYKNMYNYSDFTIVKKNAETA